MVVLLPQMLRSPLGNAFGGNVVSQMTMNGKRQYVTAPGKERAVLFVRDKKYPALIVWHPYTHTLLPNGIPLKMAVSHLTMCLRGQVENTGGSAMWQRITYGLLSWVAGPGET